MAVKIPDSTDRVQLVPNVKEVADKITLEITTSLTKLGLQDYSGEAIKTVLEEYKKSLDGLSENKADKNFAGEGEKILKDLKVDQDAGTGKVTITLTLVSPSTKATETKTVTFESIGSETSTRISNLESGLQTVESKIPSQASASNQVADKDFVNSSIAQSAADRVCYDSEGHGFPTHGALTTAHTFYKAGKPTTPDTHDYALVIADEDAPEPYNGGQTRYEYKDGQWEYAYGINDRPFTDAERKALESGITKEKREAFEKKYDKPEDGIPKTDLDSSVQASLGLADSALQETDKTELDGKITQFNTDLGRRIDTLSQTHSTDKEELERKITTLEGTVSTNKTEIEQTVSQNKTELERQITSNKEELDGEISTLKETVNQNKTDLGQQISQAEETLSQQLSTDKTELESKIKERHPHLNPSDGSKSEVVVRVKSSVDDSQETDNTRSISVEYGTEETDNDPALTSLWTSGKTQEKITELSSEIDTKLTKKADITYVDQEVGKTVTKILDSAPTEYDTLKEIADWIAKDETGTTALINRVSKLETNDKTQDDTLTRHRENLDTQVQNLNAEIKTRADEDAKLAAAISQLETGTGEAGEAIKELIEQQIAAKADQTYVEDNLNLKLDKVDYQRDQETLNGDLSGINSQISGIEEKIPAQASKENQLADKDFVNSSINNMAAHRLTADATGNPFPTRAALQAASEFYYRKELFTPTEGDYTIITADEEAPAPFTGGQTRWRYDGAQWIYDYGVNNRPFTSAENKALESGVTAEVVGKANSAYQKPEDGIPKTDLATDVQTSLDKADTALQSFTEVDPTVPAWAKEKTKPSYTKDEIGLDQVENTADKDKPISTKQQEALDLKQDKSIQVESWVADSKVGTNVETAIDSIIQRVKEVVTEDGDALIQSVAGKTGAVTLDKTDVGLDQVDNTPDENKPVSTLQQQAIEESAENVKSELTQSLSDGLAKKVNIKEGWDLSENNYSDDDVSKLGGIEDNAQVNVIEKITVNSVESKPDGKKTVNITVPTKPGDIGAQPALVSGTSIKTINSESLLGEGDIDLPTKSEVLLLSNVEQTVQGQKTFLVLPVVPSKESEALSTGKTVLATEAQVALAHTAAKNAQSTANTAVSNAQAAQGTADEANELAGEAKTLAESKYSKPKTGIPKTDLASEVQTSLGKADTALQAAAKTELEGKITAVQKRVESLEAMGTLVGIYNTPEDLPDTVSEVEDFTITVNDFATVRQDPNHSNRPCCYSVTKIEADAITWTYEFTYSDDVTGKVDKVVGAVENNIVIFGANGDLKDSKQTLSSYATKTEVNAKYTKPDGGIPKTHLASEVQTSLGKADTALQSVPDATTSTPGLVKLGSDKVQEVAAGDPSTTTGKTYAIQKDSNGKLVVNVPWANTTYNQATSSTLGLVKIGASGLATKNYAVQLNEDGQMFVAVPWTDNDTTYKIATKTTAGLVKPIDVITKPAINVVSSTAGKYYSVEMSDDGNMFVNVPWTDNNTNTAHEHTVGEGLSLEGSGGVSGTVKYSLKTATATALGGIKAAAVRTAAVTTTQDTTSTSQCYGIQLDNTGKGFVQVPWTNTTYNIATATVAGLVKPVSVIAKPTINNASTTTGKYYPVQMSSDGTMFVNIPWTDNNTTYSQATTANSGLIPALPKGSSGFLFTSGNNDISFKLPKAGDSENGLNGDGLMSSGDHKGIRAYVCTVYGTDSETTVIPDITAKKWGGNEGNYFCTISDHGKGELLETKAIKVPKVRTFIVDSTNPSNLGASGVSGTDKGILIETFDSSVINYTTGAVTVYSTGNIPTLVMIY